MTMPFLAGIAVAVIVIYIVLSKISYAKSQKRINLQKELQDLRREYGIAQGLFCPQKDNEKYAQMVKDGNPLPDGIYEYKDSSLAKKFYTVCAPDISADEIAELLTYKKLGYLRTIKNCLVYFVALTIIGFCTYLIIINQSF